MKKIQDQKETGTISNVEGNGKAEGIIIFTPEEAAEALGIKVAHVKRLLRNGELKGKKVGKFWRITRHNMDEYFESDNGNGTGHMKEEVKEKISFHAQVRSQKNLPSAIEKITEKIQDIKARIQAQEGLEKASTAYKLKTALMLKKEKEQRAAGIPTDLNEMAEKIFPGMLALINLDPDALEQTFLNEIDGAQEPHNANAMEAAANNNQEGATNVEHHINDEEGE